MLNIPNILSFFRIILSIPIFILTISDEKYFLAALILFVIASITDYLDGFIARKLNMVTDLGKFLDQISDKIIVNIVLIALLQVGLLPGWFVAVVVTRDTLVSGIRMFLASKNVVLAADIWGKMKTVFQMVLIIYVYMENYFNFPSNITLILLTITAISTILSALNYTIKNKKQFLEE